VSLPSAILHVPILTYHDISRRFRMGITRVSPVAFRRQMEWMSQAGYQSLPVSEIATLLDHDRKLFSITFDDVYADLHDAAFPVLQQLGFKTTLAIIAGFAGEYNLWEARLGGPKLRHMEWARIKEWVDAGNEVASHGYSHRCLSGLSANDLNHEIQESKTEIENRLGIEIQTFVPPFGRINAGILDTIAYSGYRIVCVNVPIPLSRQDLTILVRLGIHRFDSLKSFRRKVQRGWESYSNVMDWKITAFCSGGTILAQRLFGKKNIP
jgi:peptidoglycan/xylan/chitin deacetylase (PgdA/CDA1 family)